MDKSNFLTGLGKRIESRRRELNITQSELAKKVGYSSHSTIAKAEAGLIDLSQTKITEIAEVLNCSPAYLMGVSPYPNETETNSNTQERGAIVIPEKYKDVAVAFHGGVDNLTQEDIDDIVRFIEFLKTKHT